MSQGMQTSSPQKREELMVERMSMRMLKLHERLAVGISFQKFRERRMQVLWLNRVKDLKIQCENLSEEIAVKNEISAEPAVINVLDNLLSFVTSQRAPSGILENDFPNLNLAGSAGIGDRISQLCSLLMQWKQSASSLHRRPHDGAVKNSLSEPNKALEERCATLEAERKINQKDLQGLSEVKGKLEEETSSLRRRVSNLEESNNFLRQQVADARREIEANAGRRDALILEQGHKKDADLIKSLTEMRDEALSTAALFRQELQDQNRNVARLTEQLSLAQRRMRTDPNLMKADDGQGCDLLQLLQLCATADKRAEDAETAYKQEQQSVWRLRQEVNFLEAKLAEAREGARSESQTSSNSPKMFPRDSSNSILSGAPTTAANGFDVAQTRRELKVLTELKETALSSLRALRSQSSVSLPSIEIAHLRAESKIGSGSFADVYHGYWKRPCAIKKMRGMTKRRQLQDFYREAEILAMLNHPGIVEFMGVCLNLPDLYLVTEFVTGSSLEEVLHVDKRRLKENEVLSIAVQIADAMQFMHVANVVHRDLKPSNCLVDQIGVVKLCDFGLARVIGDDASTNSESSRAGTPVYLAPEALQGAPITKKVDIYSFAIVCWEMVTGLQAWVTLDYKQMAAAVLRDRMRPPIPPEVRRELKDLIESCWMHDHNDRPCFSSIIVSLHNIGAPKIARRSFSVPMDNIELV